MQFKRIKRVKKLYQKRL